jgi:hypothetical protein
MTALSSYQKAITLLEAMNPSRGEFRRVFILVTR